MKLSALVLLSASGLGLASARLGGVPSFSSVSADPAPEAIPTLVKVKEENNVYTFEGTRTIYYGNYVSKEITDGSFCNVEAFDHKDPAFGARKWCYTFDGDELKTLGGYDDAMFFGGTKTVLFGVLVFKDETDGTWCSDEVFGSLDHPGETPFDHYCYIRDNEKTLGEVALGAAPAGSYEGSVTKLGQTITTHVDVVDEAKMNLKISGMFSVDCAGEAYKIEGGDISVVGADTAGNCVHDGLKNNHVALTGIVYDEAKDTITVSVKSLGMTIDTLLEKQQQLLGAYQCVLSSSCCPYNGCNPFITGDSCCPSGGRTTVNGGECMCL